MRLSPLPADPHALPPLRNEPPRPAERLALCPLPRCRPLDRLAAVLAFAYAALAFGLIYLGAR